MILSTIIGTKLAAVIASAVIAAGGLTGVGIAADDAAPGDALYSLDCQMERIGLGDGGVRERVQEAAKLVQQGDVEAGLNHAALALRNQAGLGDEAGANGALVQAANAVRNAFQTANQGEADQLQARIAEMLEWMSMNMAQGSTAQNGEFGQGVAERACEVAGVADQIRAQSQLRTQTQDQTHTQDQTRDQDQAQDQTRTTEQSQTQLRVQTQDQTRLETSTSYQNQNGEGYKGGN